MLCRLATPAEVAYDQLELSVSEAYSLARGIWAGIR